MRLASFGPVLILLLLLLSTAGTGAARAECPMPTVSPSARLSLAARPDNALIVDAAVELPAEAPLYVEYGNGEAGWLRTPMREAAARHDVPLVRLRQQTAYQVRAVTLDAAGCPAAAALGDFATGELPSGLRPKVSATSGRASVPLTLMDVRLARATEESTLGWIVAIDADGQVVWYYTLPIDLPERPGFGPTITLEALPNGNLVYLIWGYGFEEITRDARAVRRMVTAGRARPHHDFQPLPDGRLLFLGRDDRRVMRGERIEPVRGDALFVLNPGTDELERVWSTFGTLNYGQRPPHWVELTEDRLDDWTHGNNVMLGPRGNVLLSFRHLDQVVSLAPDLETIEWRLGGVDGDFAFADPSDRFYGQHHAQELAPGRILLFDNGNFRPEGDFSRGLELELDFDAMTARKVWEHRTEPPLKAPLVGSAFRLANGHTLLNFGFTTPSQLDEPRPLPGNVLTVEAGPGGAALWQHGLAWPGMLTSRNRAYPADSIAGETRVDPTPLAAHRPRGA